MGEETIELRELFQIIWKRIWIVLLISIIATATSGVVSFFYMTPIYEASTQLLVNQNKENAPNGLTSSDIRFNLDIIATYIEVISSPRILDEAISALNLNLTAEQLKSKMRVSTVKQSQVISIIVSDPDQHRAAEIANGVASTFQREITKIMNVDNVQILAEAKKVETPSPVKPKPMLNMAIAFVVGLMTAIGIIFLIEYLDNSIKDEVDVERYLQLPVLGMIAPIDDRTERKLEKLSQDIGGGAAVEA